MKVRPSKLFFFAVAVIFQFVSALSFAQPGSLDLSFGEAGFGSIEVSDYETFYLQGIAIDSQGRIVVFGSSEIYVLCNCDSEFFVARFLPDGTPDPSFGGFSKQQEPGFLAVPASPGQNNSGIGVDVLSDDSIIFGGRYLASVSPWNYVAGKLLPSDGALDTSFGLPDAQGVVPVFILSGLVSFVDFIFDGEVVIDQQDRILIGGRTGNQIQLARLLPSGQLDVTFGTGGIQILETPDKKGSSHLDYLSGLSIDAMGNIFVAVNVAANMSLGEGKGIVLKLNDSGEVLDFGDPQNNRFAELTSIEEYAIWDIFNYDNQVLVCGGYPRTGTDFSDPYGFVARLNEDGLQDLSFGVDGVVMVSSSIKTNLQHISVESNGLIVVSGTRNDGLTALPISLRLKPDGSFDPTYGDQGISRPDIGGRVIYFYALGHDNDLYFARGSSSSIDVFRLKGGPDFILGDLNDDQIVNLQDIVPFVEAIEESVFDPAADINCDGNVNLVDVSPFVDILLGIN